MTDTTEDSPFESLDDEASAEEKHEALQERIDVLEKQNEEMQDRLVDVNAENNKYQQQLERLTHENEKLKQNPLFVATVQEVMGEEVILKQHGNNQEAVTEITEDMTDDIESGDRVAINNSLSVVKKLDGETDVRARVMQVDHSPDVSYTDIGGLDSQMTEIRESVEVALDDPELFEDVGVDPPTGVLMHGPPGTGKTMLAKAVANETDASFIRLAGSDLVHKFIGEGAKLVRDLFEVARENEPAIVFIDEIDSIARERSDSKTSGDAEVQRTLMQLLNELDGFENRGDIRVIAATNRFDMLDDAILRPGRFDRIIEVPHPATEAREQIFNIHTRDMNVADDMDFAELAMQTEGVNGAQVKAICTEAGMFAIRDERKEITRSDFEASLEKVLREDTDEIQGENLAFV